MIALSLHYDIEELEVKEKLDPFPLKVFNPTGKEKMLQTLSGDIKQANDSPFQVVSGSSSEWNIHRSMKLTIS